MAALLPIAKQNLSAEDRQTCMPTYSPKIFTAANEVAERLCFHRCLFTEGERVGTPYGRVPSSPYPDIRPEDLPTSPDIRPGT